MQTEVDVLATTTTGEVITIEMQRFYHDYFYERTIFYVAGAYRSNYANSKLMVKETNKFSSFKQTYGINVLDFDCSFPNDWVVNTFVLKHEVTDELMRDFLKTHDLQLSYVNLNATDYSLCPNMKYWLQYFNNLDLDPDAPAYIKRAQEIIDDSNLQKEEKDMAEVAIKAEDVWNAILSTAIDRTREEVSKKSP